MKNQVTHISAGSVLMPLALSIPVTAKVLVLVRDVNGVDRTYERGLEPAEALKIVQDYDNQMSSHPTDWNINAKPIEAAIPPLQQVSAQNAGQPIRAALVADAENDDLQAVADDDATGE